MSRRSVVIRVLAGRWMITGLEVALRPRIERAHAAQRELSEEVRRVHREHPGDEEAVQAAVAQVMASPRANTWTTCLPALLGGVLPHATLLIPPRHQSVLDRLAGTVVVWRRRR